jgi:hypothetical protein
MEITLTTPALLFPAISLLMLAYTNRFLTLATIISMFALFAGWILAGQWSFAIALILMIVSMLISLRELQISVGALDLLLMELEKEEKRK